MLGIEVEIKKIFLIKCKKYMNGLYRMETLVYKGSISSGVTKETIAYLFPVGTKVLSLIAATENQGIVWVKPEKVCRVEYMPKTKNALRQPVFRGYWDDIMPWEVKDIIE